jgi:hypothetical protein
MQPEQAQDQPPIESGPDGNLDPNYNFIFNGQKQSKKKFRLGLPGSNNLTKITLLIVGASAILGILLIIFSSFFGSKGVNTEEVVDIVARGQEISRVSDLVALQSKDLATINLASTTSTTLNSDKKQLVNYLGIKAHKSINLADLNTYKDLKVDDQLQATNQTGGLSNYYYSYLKKYLTQYQSSLKLAGTDNPQSIKPILQQSLDSSTILLSVPGLTATTVK